MSLEQASAFLVESAGGTLRGLIATLGFLMAYIVVARRAPPGTSLGAAIAAWLLVLAVLTILPADYRLSLVLFALGFAVARAHRRTLVLKAPRVTPSPGWTELLGRGALAGGLVGLATTIGAAMGPVTAGVLTAFPIGFSVIGLTLHHRFGESVLRATLASTQTGMLSLVAFATVIAVATPPIGGIGAFWLALASALAVSTGLLYLRKLDA